MPKRDLATNAPGGDVWGGASAAIVRGIVNTLYVAVPLALVGLVLYLVVDSFGTSAESGTRSACAALLPILVGSFIRWVKAEWIEALHRLPNLGLMVGSALGTILIIALATSGAGGGLVPEFAISLAFSAMLLTRAGILDQRNLSRVLDEKLLMCFFGIAVAALLAGIFLLNGG